MLSHIIQFSIKNKLLILLFTTLIIGFGLFSLSQIPIGAVPDVTNNQVQVITTSRNLSTQDMEQFITYPVELEMANLPGVKEIRSISKFGLSVVTIVFEDAMGTYLPRQLIAEKIKAASEKIPAGFGTPEMGPITTGLGEIYQYILDVEPAFKDKYTTTDLRTIQDWIVKRQLSGIAGVVEVNTWGGYLKQYEVAVKTEQLYAMGVTVQELFEALENNNSVTGGGYIEKVNQAYFIRGEGLVKSIKDIEQIVVKKEKDGRAIYVSDIAKVGFGSATRFGAITANGEGEKVLGQVMMLKGANSKKVIDAVKERVSEIAKSLPEGVYINPFLERSELVEKTMFTVAENLILGCLIVVFVVVLLLGNIRSGLVVASVIPLCLLFALSLMYLFGVDANLLSLGAIDFGIIIDGAVIIVEFITFQITQNKAKIEAADKAERQSLKDKITMAGASKMMNSAVFGQLIILIVFIPILSLDGVEGKMFKPMALVFSFALIGAMILCFTYVPVMAALFLKPTQNADKNISAKMIAKLTAVYEPVINGALKIKKIVLLTALVLLIGSGLLYTRMGGEFVPTLDEGDFVIQPVLKIGTTLSNTIKTTTAIEKILLDSFPEVKQVVSRIGAAEIPTDPMSMEESDVIITLKPKKEWVSATTKDELAERFKEALSILPGIEIEFTQPIEMRFNELITGVRADIAIKVFGDDLEVLAQTGDQIKELVENIAGAADVSVEKTEGLPQISIVYNREKIARYGLNMEAVNQVVSMGFAGRTVGNVFEGEKRFDIVVRLAANNRQGIEDIKSLYVDLPNGKKVPLEELATITYQKGAAKISRDNTQRRIVVGINVRNRDLQSVVSDVQQVIDQNVKLPTGYTIQYGGQFENLQSATDRLLIAVPIALALIFVLLYFAFQSIKEALIIYSAIPLAAIGGILLLWWRDLPFSISAGVGFIALFGIAVLNGIVLIEHFKELKNKPFTTIEDLVKQGAKDRLRAVLLTATAAALGFLPMAISTGAGAEVQRPLATVVVGGLITSTLLTLIVLPVLYALCEKANFVARIAPKASVLMIGLLLSTTIAQAQQQSLPDLIALGVANNQGLKTTTYQIEQATVLRKTAWDIEKTEVYYGRDQNNLALNNQPLDVFGLQQTFSLPMVYKANRAVKDAVVNTVRTDYQIKKRLLERNITAVYYDYQVVKQQEAIYQTLDSLYQDFAQLAKRKFELGQTNYLEKITATAKQRQVRLQYEQTKLQAENTYQLLQQIIQSTDTLDMELLPLDELVLMDQKKMETPIGLAYYQAQEALAVAGMQLAKKEWLPAITLNGFVGTNPTLKGVLPGVQVGVQVPLFWGSTTARIRAAEIETQVTKSETKNYSIRLQLEETKLRAAVMLSQQGLDYYQTEGALLAEEILKIAANSFKNGEIDFFQYIQSIENAYLIKIDFLENLKDYNQKMIELNYLMF